MTSRLTCLIAFALALTAAPALADGHGGHSWGFCPPGLAKKDPACMPPGHTRNHGHGRNDENGDDWGDADHEGGRHGHRDDAGTPAPIRLHTGCDGPFRLMADGTWRLDPRICGPVNLAPAVTQGKDLIGGLGAQDKAILALSLLAAMMH